MKDTQTYDEWLGGIYTALELKHDLTRSDAQGITDAQPFVLAQQWALGTSAEEAAERVIKAATK